MFEARPSEKDKDRSVRRWRRVGTSDALLWRERECKQPNEDRGVVT